MSTQHANTFDPAKVGTAHYRIGLALEAFVAIIDQEDVHDALTNHERDTLLSGFDTIEGVVKGLGRWLIVKDEEDSYNMNDEDDICDGTCDACVVATREEPTLDDLDPTLADLDEFWNSVAPSDISWGLS